jgi:preprotein translocase subunit YajC
MPDLDWTCFLLAQDAIQPPAPGESAPLGTSAAPGAPAGAGTGGGAGQSPFGGSQFFMIMLLLLGGMIVFSIMGQRRERKRRDAMINAIKKHDRVQTIGGVIGSVVEVKPDYVVLKVDESSNTRITFARSAVQQVLTSSPEGASGKSEGAK